MAAEIIDGKAVSAQIREEVRLDVESLAARGVVPGLATVLVGENTASATYVRSKQRACEKAGIHSRDIRLPEQTSESELLSTVSELNGDADIDGILVQLPLPPQIEPQRVIISIDPAKDVDGFHPVNLGKLLSGEDAFYPCTPHGILVMLERSGIAVEGRHVVVVGRSNIVGKPLAALLMQKRSGANATVTVCHSRTTDLAAHTRRADILVAAAGQVGFITGDMVGEGAAVVDVGINRVDDPEAKKGYRLVGDVEFEGASERASRITPVPGGVGPMTIAMLMSNTVESARRRADG
ncbi:MAG: bifunctional methylenetetrahydrofolate dehydrogenase/methenyltetrahydrofolate cyclohydrolase FolD [Spirochaetes bacterium]|jgi:methylenetetrahydrofolate dehydrogenase (NADP+)/methenyltetrahydrofolate cyclohydrolase|nr:bifunctional methylenetetrahydrofolate dehydrogenase/methenyltetrahydrofolate cyclohydrolase FolD [Spirochaetota bacterium]